MDLHRIRFLSSSEKIHELACLKDGRNYVIFDNIHDKKDDIACTLTPAGIEYYKTSIVAGISKKFKYKRTLDIRYAHYTFTNK